MRSPRYQVTHGFGSRIELFQTTVYFSMILMARIRRIFEDVDTKKGFKYHFYVGVESEFYRLFDESQVVLRAPRKDDVYSLDLKNIVPSGEFKNHAMNEFCAKKGIKREFSVARTPQQNGVAERKNMTLIEAARTMLADSLLPIPFWAEAVNTACYVLNRVLVTKPQNKTPYELLIGSSGKDKGSTQEYIMLPLQPHRTRILVEDVAPAAHEKPSEIYPKDNDVQDLEDVAIKEGQHPHDKMNKFISNAGESSFVYLGGKIPIDASTLPNVDLPIDPNMPDLKDDSDAFSSDGIFNGAYDDENGWVEAMQEELLQFKLQKVWILVDLPSGKKAIGTKWVFKNKKDERSIVVKNKVSLVAQGFRQEEGIDYDESKGFVDPTHPNKVYKVIKALYGLHQAPRAWYETLSSFLLENGFRRGTIDKTFFIKKNKSDIMLVQVYVDDIIFGSTTQSICTEFEDCMYKRFQMSSMGELTFFLGLQVKQQPDGIFISQDKYVADILKKFDFCSIKTATTPIVSNKPLVKDEDGVDIHVHVYGSMISSMMYLTTSRPDIMFAVCACARFQVTPKASHLNAVKRIFRYLKHQPKLGLWYPRDSPFELEAFSDSDYGGASLDRKSTTGGCQFLGRRLISWQCKKQTIVANSTTKAEYVAAANCYGQVLWIQNQMMDYGFNFMNTKIHIDNESTICIVKNPVYHSRTKHIEIRHHFIRDCYEKRLIDVIKIHTDANGRQISRLRATYDAELVSAASLVNTVKPTLSTARLGKFDAAGKFGTFLSSIDSKEYNITEASVRSKLQLADAIGIHNLSDAKIYAGLATLGYLAPTLTKKLFANMQRGYAGDIIPLLPVMLAETVVDQEGEESEDQGSKIQDINDDPLVSLVRESMKEKSTNFVTPIKASGEAQEEIIPTILEAAKTLSKVASQGVSKEKSTDKGKRYRRRARSMAKKIDTRLDAEEEINTGREEINTGIEEINTGIEEVSTNGKKLLDWKESYKVASSTGRRSCKSDSLLSNDSLQRMAEEEL
ncbi:putative ribonuclease H-like domain-containing protein [Tanacetum coccineum]